MKKEYLRPEVNEMKVITEGEVMAGSTHHCTHATTCNKCGCESGIHQGCGNCPDCTDVYTNY